MCVVIVVVAAVVVVTLVRLEVETVEPALSS